jgi:hypothetical protein
MYIEECGCEHRKVKAGKSRGRTAVNGSSYQQPIGGTPNEGWVGLGEQLIHRLKIWLASPGHFTNGKPAGRFLGVILVIG